MIQLKKEAFMHSDLFRPVEARERLGHLDMLRGFALFGVLLSNIEYWFRAPKAHEWLSVSAFPGLGNELASWLVRALIETKFIFIFSLLFGVGLMLQKERIEKKGGRFGPFVLRRLCVLLIFGILHVVLIWNGDILVPYAIIGMLMLFFVCRKAKTIGIWILVIWCVVLLLMLMGPVKRMLGPAPKSPTPEVVRAWDAEEQKNIDELAAGYRASNWLDVTMYRIRDYKRVLHMSTGGFLAIFLNMLLGLFLWKRGTLREPSAHMVRLRRFCVWALPLGLLMHIIYASRHILLAWARTVPWALGRWVRPVTELSMILGMLVLGLAFIAGLLLLYHRPAARRKLKLFEPLGQMALTTYLTQSLVLSFIFYGWGLGLYNRTGALAGVLIGIGLFILQIFFARWWLTRYRFGPVEWLWRCLTYGKRQPFRRQN